ncbi:uncharacterized protein Triagg1_4701 [Trichoderma aggressivum f. europaeum]|uniref:Uncharacterized protein n=1 Tax=Trichoderma aggressivum f. europaeum TaxID=173218 RepID=A0AAE1IE69_9HYPO|nr:hypothetical protein Triagg1_4701 [Trichoderma aggressivum f. europaeum]
MPAPARPLTARGPPSMVRRPASPSPYRLAESSPSEIILAAGNSSTGCWAAPGITDRFGPQAVAKWQHSDAMQHSHTPPPLSQGQLRPKTQDPRRPCLGDADPTGNIEKTMWRACASLGRVAHTPAPWPRFSSPRDARYAPAALDGAGRWRYLWSGPPDRREEHAQCGTVPEGTSTRKLDSTATGQDLRAETGERPDGFWAT